MTQYPPACHGEVLERLARIETKLDDTMGVRADHETRIRSLEVWRYLTTGGATAVGALFGFLVSHLPKL